MTAEEKAKELVDKYREAIMSFLTDRMKDENAKRCALIAVNEIINTIEYSSQADELSKTSYWDKVNQYIEKL